MTQHHGMPESVLSDTAYGKRQAKLEVSIVVCTAGRVEPLAQCIEHVLRQDPVPKEIVIIDSDSSDAVPQRVRALVSSSRTNLIYTKQKTAGGVYTGIADARNLGASISTGDIVLFLDDDAMILPGYVKSILSIYQTDIEGQVAGVAGVEVKGERQSPRVNNWLRKWVRVFFLIESPTGGRITPSGFYSDIASDIKQPQRVEHLPGYGMSFRRSILDRYHFEEVYDDIDFSYRVSRRYKLVVAPAAKIIHTRSSEKRPTEIQLNAKQGWVIYLFLRKNKSPLNYIPLLWSLLMMKMGLLMAHALRVDPNAASKLKGTIKGEAAILRSWLGLVTSPHSQTKRIIHG